MTDPVDTETLLATGAVHRLAARVFAGEVDLLFYRALLELSSAPGAQFEGQRLLDPDIQALGAEAAITELAAEYCRLFVGPRPACPPYASVHHGEAVVGGRARQRIDAFLDRYELDPSIPDGLPVLSPDHIAVTFAVLAHLCIGLAGEGEMPVSRAAQALRELRESTLVDWVPVFLRKVAGETGLAPYRPVARLALRLVADENLWAGQVGLSAADL